MLIRRFRTGPMRRVSKTNVLDSALVYRCGQIFPGSHSPKKLDQSSLKKWIRTGKISLDLAKIRLALTR